MPIHTPVVTPNVFSEIASMEGRGTPLSASERTFFEPRFGYDFSKVRLHTDRQAAGLSDALQAKAFTVGRDIVFGKGQNTPGTTEGRRLLAHELVHTIQQQGTNRPRVQRSTQQGQEDYFDPDNCWTKNSSKEATDRVIGNFIGILDVPSICDGAIKMTMRFEVVGSWSLLSWLGGSAGPLLFTPTANSIDTNALIKGKKTVDDSSFEYDLSYPLTPTTCAVNFDVYLLLTYRRAGHHANFAEVRFSPATRLGKGAEEPALIDDSPAPIVRVDSCGRLQPTTPNSPGGPAPIPRDPNL